MEPNNGATATQLDSITVPGAKQGAIGTANDLDIYALPLTAGQRLRWTLDSNSSSFAPYLSISEAMNTVPIVVARGTVGGSVFLEQLVVKTATYLVIARDARNVPSSTSQNAGSAQHTYVLNNAVSTVTPTTVLVPSTTPATFASRYANAVFRFTLTTSTAVTLNLNATGDADTRLTLFNTSTNQWFGTNDDLALGNKNSKLTGTLTAGDYLAVCDNVSETANNLGFTLGITSP